MRKLPAVPLPLPLGEVSPQVTERAHAVSPVAKVSDATRNFLATAQSRPLGEGGCDQREQTEGESRPQRRAFAESGAVNAVCRYDPFREKGVLKSPRLRSNKSPSGAFKRQSGLRKQMEGLCPDKLRRLFRTPN